MNLIRALIVLLLVCFLGGTSCVDDIDFENVRSSLRQNEEFMTGYSVNSLAQYFFDAFRNNIFEKFIGAFCQSCHSVCFNSLNSRRG